MGAAAIWSLPPEILSADEAVEQLAAKLGSERDAIHYLTVLVRNLALPVFRQEVFNDGTEQISPYTSEEARAAWLDRYDDGGVRDLHDGSRIPFRRTDFETPPLVEPAKQPSESSVGDCRP